MLFGASRDASCCVCGRTFPVEFLVAAHIKKRAECTLEEKKDFRNIAASMCRFGCDELYERHYIYVDDGVVRVNESKSLTPALEIIARPLDGANCTAAKPSNKKYFQWHLRRAKNLPLSNSAVDLSDLL